jgi:hypothetical protein
LAGKLALPSDEVTPMVSLRIGDNIPVSIHSVDRHIERGACNLNARVYPSFLSPCLERPFRLVREVAIL